MTSFLTNSDVLNTLRSVSIFQSRICTWDVGFLVVVAFWGFCLFVFQPRGKISSQKLMFLSRFLGQPLLYFHPHSSHKNIHWICSTALPHTAFQFPYTKRWTWKVSFHQGIEKNVTKSLMVMFFLTTVASPPKRIPANNLKDKIKKKKKRKRKKKENNLKCFLIFGFFCYINCSLS